MQILHIDLKPAGKDDIELRFFVDNYLKPEFRRLPSSQISELIKKAEESYYTYFPENYATIGSQLYNWLDSNDRFLQKFLDENQYEEIIILAISTSEKLAHLPWEILHDGEQFLVEKDIIPVRWCRGGKKLLSQEDKPENRSLQLLFMATSPQDIETVLEFEEEEKRIQEATAKQPLTLTVEESGCLEELDNLVKNYGKGYFDVFHLTGHGTFEDGEPRFITETETGDACYASAKDILKSLKPQLPKLIFLSGCHTGQAAKKGIIPSLAESLLKGKAKAILGWGNSVTTTYPTNKILLTQI